MRKVLISIVVCLLLVGSIFIMISGVSKLNISGIKDIDKKNNQVEETISKLSNVISVTYANTESNLKRAANTLQDSKTEYENQAILSKSAEPSYVSQLETYDIDYLWTKLGNYAKNEGVVIKIDVVSGGASTNLYNLNFTVNGSYVSITDFIYDIENDSKLGFKIDDFKMNPSTESSLVATFTCKEVPIKVGKVDASGTSDNTTDANNTTGTTDGTQAQAANGTENSNTATTTTNQTTTTNTAVNTNTTN